MSQSASATPAVSVLVTAFRHSAYVERALASVAAQTFCDYELIITDDCSGDSTADVIRRWLERTQVPATFLANEVNMGICAVKNQALRHAKGRYVCSLAADDWFEPERLERHVRFMDGLPAQVGFVYSDSRLVDPEGEPLGETSLQRSLGSDAAAPEGDICARLLRGNFIPAHAVMLRRSAIDDVGGYDESLAYEDYFMWLEIARRYQVRFLPGVVTTYRVLPTSMSHSPEWRARMMLSQAIILHRWVGVDEEYDRALAAHVGSRRPHPSSINARLRRWARRHADTHAVDAARVISQTERSPRPTVAQQVDRALMSHALGRATLRRSQTGYDAVARATWRVLNRMRGG
jgi:glycosyltransferase involved in cell wall biosynthesis